MIGLTLTWVVFGIVLVLFGARAWVVETSRGRFSTGGRRQRGLTAAVAASLVLLVVMAMFNGGFELISLLAEGKNNAANQPGDAAPVNPGAPDAGAPGGPAAPGAPIAPAP